MVAVTALNLPIGTMYAFSVFLRPMEQLLAIGRTQMSIVFAAATISLTVGMNLAPRLYRSHSPVLLLVVGGIGSTVGVVLAATAQSFTELLVGYGLLFGLGGGIGFTVLQQAVNQVEIKRRGLVNGYVVSLFPLGAMIGAPLFGWAIAAHGLRATLAGLAVAVLLMNLLAAWLLRWAQVQIHDASLPKASAPPQHWSVFARLFALFFLAAAAGLMVLSQAAGIVQAYGGTTALALGATVFITASIAAARIGGGWLVDRFSIPHVGIGAQLFGLAGALALAIWPNPAVAVPALAMIGMGYGFVSGLAVGAIGHYWHRNSFGAVASRLYIAWCAAAVSLPILAGWLFDRTQGYGTAVIIAGAVNLLGAVVASRLPAQVR
jgi:MFS transporter, OFA family, oxalate/formate antiporter